MDQKWSKDWKRTKKEFETLTGQKKPSTKLVGVFRKSSGLESVLKKCDAGLDGIEKNWTKGKAKQQKSFDDMQKAIDAFGVEKTKYINLLDASIKKEAEDSGAKTVYLRGLKMLKTKLDQYEASYEESLAFHSAKQQEDEKYSDRHWKIAAKKLKSAIATGNAKVQHMKTIIAKKGDDAWTDFVSDIPVALNELKYALDDVEKAREHAVDLADPAPIQSALDSVDKKRNKLKYGSVTGDQMLVVVKELRAVLKQAKSRYGL